MLDISPYPRGEAPASNRVSAAASFLACGGGGYGQPSGRSPDRVVGTINRGWLTPARATEVYGVKVRLDEATAQYQLADWTRRLCG